MEGNLLDSIEQNRCFHSKCNLDASECAIDRRTLSSDTSPPSDTHCQTRWHRTVSQEFQVEMIKATAMESETNRTIQSDFDFEEFARFSSPPLNGTCSASVKLRRSRTVQMNARPVTPKRRRINRLSNLENF